MDADLGEMVGGMCISIAFPASYWLTVVHSYVSLELATKESSKVLARLADKERVRLWRRLSGLI